MMPIPTRERCSSGVIKSGARPKQYEGIVILGGTFFSGGSSPTRDVVEGANVETSLAFPRTGGEGVVMKAIWSW
jgi:hypothetical protein